MSRIRAIKPEFWNSPGIETLDPFARLLFIAMWNWADDSGVGDANHRKLLGFAFPLDENITLVDLRRWLVEITRVFEVVFYTNAGRPYYSIPSWEIHQKFDRRSKGKYPGPDDPKSVPILDEPPDDIHTRGNPTSARSDYVAGTGEQGNRGTGEITLKSQPYVTSATEKFHDADNHTNRILTAWTDTVTKRPPGKVIADVATQIKTMIAEGIPDEYIGLGIKEWWQGKYPPSTIPNYVANAQNQRGAKAATGTSRAADILAIDTSSIPERIGK